MKAEKSVIIIELANPSLIEIFEMEALPTVREKFDFTYEKQIKEEGTLFVITCKDPSPAFPLSLGMAFGELTKGLKKSDMEKENIEPSIICPTCHKKSFHPKDISEKYCGYCNKFHEQL